MEKREIRKSNHCLLVPNIFNQNVDPSAAALAIPVFIRKLISSREQISCSEIIKHG